MLVTLPVSKSSGWSKMPIWLNMKLMLTTLLVSNGSGWLNASAPRNVAWRRREWRRRGRGWHWRTVATNAQDAALLDQDGTAITDGDRLLGRNMLLHRHICCACRAHAHLPARFRRDGYLATRRGRHGRQRGGSITRARALGHRRRLRRRQRVQLPRRRGRGAVATRAATGPTGRGTDDWPRKRESRRRRRRRR